MKVFIAGPRAVKRLDENILKKINDICQKNFEILIGDANGIDSLVQNYLKNKNYKNVEIYASNGKARNNFNNWNVVDVEVENRIKGFDFYAQKDKQMAKDADTGFMIWNGESRGTFNNIINLLNQEKKVLLYLVNTTNFYFFKTREEFEYFIVLNKIKLNTKLEKILKKSSKKEFDQISILD